VDIKTIDLDETWKDALRGEFPEADLSKLRSFVENEFASKKEIYPPKPEIFAAFDLTPFDQVKVVLIGQDPYHGPGQAHGLCFSVRDGVPLPPSLRNIFKEVSDEFDSAIRTNGDLTGWATQGVLLLNRALTVEEGKAGSHQSQWECFTDAIIKTLAAKKENLIFIAWGNPAKKAVAQIDRGRHLVLESVHPSPLSANPARSSGRPGFFGNGHFQKANDYLRRTNQKPIIW
jgi:uracil-DNA glycosylase